MEPLTWVWIAIVVVLFIGSIFCTASAFLAHRMLSNIDRRVGDALANLREWKGVLDQDTDFRPDLLTEINVRVDAFSSFQYLPWWRRLFAPIPRGLSPGHQFAVPPNAVLPGGNAGGTAASPTRCVRGG